MQKILLVLALIAPILLFPTPVQAAKGADNHTVEIKAKRLDNRAIILRDYFKKYNSPLEDHAQDFVEAADTYGVDWKLVAAISGVESTFGKRTPGSDLYPSYNGWGWGVYGTQTLYFKSWRDGIFTVTEGLKKNYIDKGLTTPLAMNKKYAASPTWGVKVNYFIKDIEKFAENYPDTDRILEVSDNLDFNEKNTSAKLTLVALR